MNNPIMINPNPQMQQNYNPYQTLPFVLVQDMAMANSYNIGPGASAIFISQDEFKALSDTIDKLVSQLS